MSADTGVGPAMASGNQVYKGIWADLPVAPTNNKSVIIVTVGPVEAFAKTSPKVVVPNWLIIQKIAIRNTRSPIRFMMKAFLAALLYSSFLNQYPISK